jgi:predicted RNA-binding protein
MIKLSKLKGDKMCESTVYATDGTKIMEDVINIKIEGKMIHLIDILNTQKNLEGVITEIDLDKHGIYVDLK